MVVSRHSGPLTDLTNSQMSRSISFEKPARKVSCNHRHTVFTKRMLAGSQHPPTTTVFRNSTYLLFQHSWQGTVTTQLDEYILITAQTMTRAERVCRYLLLRFPLRSSFANLPPACWTELPSRSIALREIDMRLMGKGDIMDLSESPFPFFLSLSSNF